MCISQLDPGVIGMYWQGEGREDHVARTHAHEVRCSCLMRAHVHWLQITMLNAIAAPLANNNDSNTSVGKAASRALPVFTCVFASQRLPLVLVTALCRVSSSRCGRAAVRCHAQCTHPAHSFEIRVFLRM